MTDSAGALIGIDRYDEYGRPQSSNIGRFQYTGQMWLSEIGAYHYKARVYLPHLGIFAQTDPAGYDPSPNLYAYVGNNPINAIDPSGMFTVCAGNIENHGSGCVEVPDYAAPDYADIIVVGKRIDPMISQTQLAYQLMQMGTTSYAPSGGLLGGAPQPRPVPAPKLPPYNPNINYCGPQSGTALPNEVAGVPINDICYTLDVCYGASGTAKATCDLNFASAILLRVERFSVADPYIRSFYAIGGALSAYSIVSFFGGVHYVP